MSTTVDFKALKSGSLTIKNRVVRSSVAGRFENYDGSGSEVRINWDIKFARRGGLLRRLQRWVHVVTKDAEDRLTGTTAAADEESPARKRGRARRDREMRAGARVRRHQSKLC